MRAEALTLLVALGAACSSSKTTPPDGGGPPAPIPCDEDGLCPGNLSCDPVRGLCIASSPADAGCPAPLVFCGLTCTDTQVDPLHCGSCSNACATGQSCVGGSCSSASTCFFCGPAQTCVNGTCVCPAGSTTCSSLFCIDTTQSTAGCGSCTQMCTASGQACRAGMCVCPSGTKVCNSGCQDVEFDNGNCGDCGVTCDGGQLCDRGQCLATCADNPTNACQDGRCYNVGADPNHCGPACAVCARGQECDAGQCACPPGSQDIGGGVCTDLSRDPSNCGAPGNACVAGSTCSGGQCACPPPLLLCGGACIDVSADHQNCGACGHACPASLFCLGASCVSSCGFIPLSCDGGCPDPGHDPANCGACGNACAGGQICLDGACSAVRPARGCQACPCDDCDFAQQALCCLTDAGPTCVKGFRCP